MVDAKILFERLERMRTIADTQRARAREWKQYYEAAYKEIQILKQENESLREEIDDLHESLRST